MAVVAGAPVDLHVYVANEFGLSRRGAHTGTPLALRVLDTSGRGSSPVVAATSGDTPRDISHGALRVARGPSGPEPGALTESSTDASREFATLGDSCEHGVSLSLVPPDATLQLDSHGRASARVRFTLPAGVPHASVLVAVEVTAGAPTGPSSAIVPVVSTPVTVVAAQADLPSVRANWRHGGTGHTCIQGCLHIFFTGPQALLHTSRSNSMCVCCCGFCVLRGAGTRQGPGVAGPQLPPVQHARLPGPDCAAGNSWWVPGCVIWHCLPRRLFAFAAARFCPPVVRLPLIGAKQVPWEWGADSGMPALCCCDIWRPIHTWCQVRSCTPTPRCEGADPARALGSSWLALPSPHHTPPRPTTQHTPSPSSVHSCGRLLANMHHHALLAPTATLHCRPVRRPCGCRAGGGNRGGGPCSRPPWRRLRPPDRHGLGVPAAGTKRCAVRAGPTRERLRGGL